MTPYEIITKLIGPIAPLGECCADEKRAKNLEETVTLVDLLLSDIEIAANSYGRTEASMNAIGYRAKVFLREVGESLDEFREEGE